MRLILALVMSINLTLFVRGDEPKDEAEANKVRAQAKELIAKYEKCLLSQVPHSVPPRFIWWDNLDTELSIAELIERTKYDRPNYEEATMIVGILKKLPKWALPIIPSPPTSDDVKQILKKSDQEEMRLTQRLEAIDQAIKLAPTTRPQYVDEARKTGRDLYALKRQTALKLSQIDVLQLPDRIRNTPGK